MKRLWRSRRRRFKVLAASVAVAVVASVAAIALGDPLVASANTGGSITASGNSSDPELIQCPNSIGTGLTLCLFTSEDGIPAPYGAENNYYPMNRTKMFRLRDNTDASDPANWDSTIVLTERALWSAGVPQFSYHLWAPGARYIDGKYFLFVPDVLNRSAESTSSRIFVFKSTNGLAASYDYLGQIETAPPFTTAPNTGYASDPQVALPYDGNRWLFYANGDNSNCGGISYAQLNPADMSKLVTPPREAVINGMENSGLGKGSACGSFNRPYVEGPAMYRWDEIGAPWAMPYWYVLVFAAKPGDGVVPPGCDSDNSVIAYAGSNSIDGPWDYQGIIQCGSSTEWTDQASITPHTAKNGKTLIAWHDGGGPNHNRRTHLSCVLWGTDLKIIRVPRSDWNLSNCA